MNSREKILQKLRRVQQPFADLPPIETRQHMVPIEDTSPEGLQARFIEEAEKLSARVYTATSDADAVKHILSIIGDDKHVLSWDVAHIPLPGLEAALSDAKIQIADVRDDTVRVGITGCEAALAATGSIVLATGAGKARSASLLPVIHIAVIRCAQFLPDFESWIAQQRDKGLGNFQESANIVLISGPSRTADIAGELNLGVHGPGEVHLILVD